MSTLQHMSGLGNSFETESLPGALPDNMLLPHGSDASAFETASTADLKPHKITNTIVYMFEPRFPQKLTGYSSELPSLDHDYINCWTDLKRKFDRSKP
jgi:homogentisate 1,2-dioxygenase